MAVATLQAEAAARGKEGGGSFLGAAGSILGNIFGNLAGTEKGAGAIIDLFKFS